jgi:guanine deaminase
MSQAPHEQFMRRAIDLARKSALEDRAGGPFGAVVVRAGAVVGEGANRVIAERDPTWHGEVAAIRDACRRLGTHDLSGCDLYTSGYPCPMCYGASWWARIRRIYYAASMEDAFAYGGFDDRLIYEQLGLPDAERRLALVRLLPDEMRPVWLAFHALPNRVHY